MKDTRSEIAALIYTAIDNPSLAPELVTKAEALVKQSEPKPPWWSGQTDSKRFFLKAFMWIFGISTLAMLAGCLLIWPWPEPLPILIGKVLAFVLADAIGSALLSLVAWAPIYGDDA